MTNAEKLDNFLKNIPHADYSTKIEELIGYLEITENILYHYRKEITYMRKSVRNDIEKFFNEKIF